MQTTRRRFVGMIGTVATALVVPVMAWRRENDLHVNEIVGVDDDVMREFRGHAFVNCRFVGRVSLYACVVRDKDTVQFASKQFAASHCYFAGNGSLVPEDARSLLSVWPEIPPGFQKAVRLANSVHIARSSPFSSLTSFAFDTGSPSFPSTSAMDYRDVTSVGA